MVFSPSKWYAAALTIGLSVVIAFSPDANAAPAAAKAAAPKSKAQPVVDPDLAMVDGDIRLDGKIGGINTANGSLLLEAVSFSLPSGRTQRFKTSKTKVIAVGTQTVIHARGDSAFTVAQDDLKSGLLAIVIGRDAGGGKPLAAGRLVLWSRVVKGKYLLDLPRQDSGGDEAAPPATEPATGTTTTVTLPATAVQTPATTLPPNALPAGTYAGPQMTLAFAPDGRSIAATGYLLRDLPPGTNPKNQGLTMFGDDPRKQKKVAGALLRQWEVPSGEPQHTMQVFDATPPRLKSTTIDQAMGEFGESFMQILVMGGIDGPAWSLAYSLDGKTLAAGSFDHTIKLWDTTTQKLTATLRGHTGHVGALAFSPDGKTLAGGAGLVTSLEAAAPPGKPQKAEAGELILWDVTTAKAERTLQTAQGSVVAVTFSPDGKWIAAANCKFMAGSSVTVWDRATGVVTWQHNLPKVIVNALTFSPDSMKLVGAGGGPVFQLQAPPPTKKETGKQGAALVDGKVMWWDAADGKLLQTLTGHDEGGLAAVFTPDGASLATIAGDPKTQLGGVNLWDAATGEWQRLIAPGTVPLAVAYAGDGAHLAVSRGMIPGQIQLWNAATGEMVRSLGAPTTP